MSMIALPTLAWADSDEPINLSAGLQPLSEPLPHAHRFHNESRLLPRDDGSYQAVPEVRGKTKIFRFVEREAPWTLRPGLTVMAKTYNGVVPGPTIVVNQGDHVVIELLNALNIPDTLHLHGIHGGSVEMDGVEGISQRPIQPGTEDLLDSGLYGGIIVNPRTPRPEEIVAHDYLQIISSWKIQSLGENHFTINGKSYPATKALDISSGKSIRIRWINISAESDHTMHTHGHDQLVIARDAQPLDYRDKEDTILLGPGQRADVVVAGDAKPGTWLIHCHVMDHVEDMNSMPDGLITALHYTGTTNMLMAMHDTMMHHHVQAQAMQKTMPKPRVLDPWAITVLCSFTGLTTLLTFLLTAKRRLPQETMLGLTAVGGITLTFLCARIFPNLTYPLMQDLRAWNGGAAFPLLHTIALIAGLIFGFASMCVSIQRARGNSVGAARVFAQGLAIGAAAISGATLLALILIVGFALYNAIKGCSTRGHITLITLSASIPILLGTWLAYTLSDTTSSTFFFAVAIGTLIQTIGESAAEILITVSSRATDGSYEVPPP
jgi:hypothetical protein